jgi:hypothetical protein
MSTKKRRIATYIPTEIEDKFQAFKKEREVGDSQALILILTEFLGVSYQVTHSSDLLSELKSELLSKLQEEVVKLEGRMDELKIELKSSLPFKEENHTSSIVLKNEKTTPKKVKKEIIKELDSREILSVSPQLLAPRLGYTTPQSLVNMKNKCLSMQDFGEKTRLKDPDGIAWAYVKKDGVRSLEYFPQSELSSELESKLLEWIQAASLSEGEAEAQTNHP